MLRLMSLWRVCLDGLVVMGPYGLKLKLKHLPLNVAAGVLHEVNVVLSSGRERTVASSTIQECLLTTPMVRHLNNLVSAQVLHPYKRNSQ